MTFLRLIRLPLLILTLSSCGSLEKKTILISPGDTKPVVLDIMGVPDDRQFKGGLTYSAEAWQYCISGAGFGYNDHRIIWFENGLVTGITSYKTYRTDCAGQIQAVNWTRRPDVTIQTQAR